MNELEKSPVEYLFPVHYRTVAGCRLACLDEGTGNPPILFLHGHASAIVEWDSSVSMLRERFRCIVPDLPGHGLSCLPPAGQASLDGIVRAVVSLLDALDCGPAVIVGHSMGGRVGAHVSLRRPDLVRGLVLVNAPADQPLPLSLKLITRLTPLALVPWFFRSGPLLRSFLRRYSSRMVREPNPLTRRKSQYFREVRAGPELSRKARYITALGRDLFRDDLHLRLGGIRAPVLVIWSDGDHTCPLRSAERITKRVPQSKLVLIRGCAHNPHLEHFEAFHEHLRAFVDDLKVHNYT